MDDDWVYDEDNSHVEKSYDDYLEDDDGLDQYLEEFVPEGEEKSEETDETDVEVPVVPEDIDISEEEIEPTSEEE